MKSGIVSEERWRIFSNYGVADVEINLFCHTRKAFEDTRLCEKMPVHCVMNHTVMAFFRSCPISRKAATTYPQCRKLCHECRYTEYVNHTLWTRQLIQVGFVDIWMNVLVRLIPSK